MENNNISKTESIKNFLKSGYFLRPFIGTLAGALLGFLYYYYVGCNSGTCAITSNPYMSIIFGGLFGFFIVSSPCSRGKC